MEIQEDGDSGSGGDAGRVTEEMRRQHRLLFLDDNHDGRRHILAKDKVGIKTEEFMMKKQTQY